YRQFSFNYQRLALQIAECILKVSNKTKISLSKIAINRIKQSALLMYQCQSNDGNMPNYGSNDGALVFPVTSCDYRDFRPIINTIYAMIKEKVLYENGLYNEELLWFSDRSDFEIENIERKSTAFYEAGLFTLRSNNSFMMICSNNYTSRPAHMDQL